MNHLVLLKNAVANVLRGSAAALVAIILPPFLTRMMPNTTYGAWVLILQLSAYVGYLDFGIQTAVGRFIAHANELGDAHQRDRIVSTSLSILTGAAGLGLILIGFLGWQMPHLFHEMPASLHREARLTLLLVGGSLAIGLPFSVFNGIFVGLQRYEIPAMIIGGSKLVGAVLLVIVAQVSGNIIYMGIVLASINLVAYGIQFAVSRRLANQVRISWNSVSKRAGREIFGYCFSLSIWSFAMLLISGLDTTLVGLLGFSNISYYSVAATLVTFIAGLQIALFNVLMPASAVLGARGDTNGLGKLLLTSTRLGMFVLEFVGLPLIVFAQELLTLWVGPAYAAKAAILLQILVIANIVRLSAVPYATLLVGTGQQRLIILSPIIEGVTNLLVSIIAGILFGTIGVAIGTLVGSIVAILCNFIYSMPRSTEISISRWIYFKDGIGRPVVSAIPVLCMLLILKTFWSSSILLTLILVLGASAASFVTLWKVGTTSEEHNILRTYTTYTFKAIVAPFS